jgi:hypothetical protein
MPHDGQKRQDFRAIARAVHTTLRVNESPVISTRTISKQESQTTLPVGYLRSAGDGSATVCVQLIDLREVAITANVPKESLRLLLTLQKDGVETYLRGPKGALEGEFAGSAENEGRRWEDGELHLMNLFLKTEDRLTTFDVVVVCSEAAP